MQEKILEIESYLFHSQNKVYRTIPFYELSIDEWVIYENGKPTYYIDFNRRTDPMVINTNNLLIAGIDPESIVKSLGDSVGRKWTLKHNIEGNEVPGTERMETVSLWVLTDIRELSTNRGG